jgi:putative FmdB family regulatory protein
MPLYEYYCDHCDGIFETLRQMREASEPAPCPVCDRDGKRIMPTSFSAFTFREGLPRRIPDRGTYWHLNKEVKTKNTGGVPYWAHPETYKPEQKPRQSPGEKEVQRDIDFYKRRHAERMKDSDFGTPPIDQQGNPLHSPNLGM